MFVLVYLVMYVYRRINGVDQLNTSANLFYLKMECEVRNNVVPWEQICLTPCLVLGQLSCQQEHEDVGIELICSILWFLLITQSVG